MKINKNNNFDKNTPLVSVVIPVYNAGKYLCGALDSILDQTYKNLEIICIDDGSVDDSFLILNDYKQYDERIKVYKNKQNRGIGDTANLLNTRAQGKYIARMDADDIALPNRIEKQVAFLENNLEVVAVGGQCLTIDEHGTPTGYKVFPLSHDQIYNLAFNAVPIQQPTMMINKALLPRNYQWYDNKFTPVDDLDFYFRLFSFGKVANLPDIVLKYREYATSSSLRDPKKSFYLTFTIRNKSEKQYGYKPAVKAKFLNMLQFLAVMILPAKLIFPTFRLFRRLKTKKLQKEILSIQYPYLDTVKTESLKEKMGVKAYDYQRRHL